MTIQTQKRENLMWIWFKRVTLSLIFLFTCTVFAVIGLYFWVKPELPDITQLKNVQLETPMKIYSADGKLISQFGEKRRIPLALADVPQLFIDAILATEDTRFYEHFGIDPIGITRAAIVWLSSGKAKQGASTITQQVARNFFLTREKTIIRKIKEVFLAWHIEQLLSKDEILELYLNKIPLGQRAFGIGAAAQVYYGKEVHELTLAQMAMIAGLPQAPSVLNPLYSTSRASDRRAVVLGRMLETGKISAVQYELALDEPIETKYHGAEIELQAPYLAEMVRQYMLAHYGDIAYTYGFNVYTTVNSSQQVAAEQAVIDGLIAYDMRHGYRGPEAQLWHTQAERLTKEDILAYLEKQSTFSGLSPAVVTQVEHQSVQVLFSDGHMQSIPWDGLKWARPYLDDNRQGKAPDEAKDILKPGALIRVQVQGDGQLRLSQIPDVNAALISLKPENGALAALVGGFNFYLSKFNRVNQAKRLVGSTIKPFIYATALEQGHTLASLIDDAPINEWDPSQGIAWRPKNAPAIYNGPTRLRDGLARSKNVMTIRLLRRVGLPIVVDTLTRFQFPKEEIPRNESLSLGAIALTPMQLATGFAVFANGGFLVAPYFISHIEDSYNNRIFSETPQIACPTCDQSVSIKQHCLEYDHEDQCVKLETQSAFVAPRIISEQNAFLVADALRTAIWGDGSWAHGTGWNGTGWRTAKALKRHDISGKTGTTNDARDAWFVGFNPELLTTVWIGFDDYLRALGRTDKNENLSDPQIAGGEFGSNAAQPIWIQYNQAVLASVPEQKITPPPGIVSVRIDRKTGLLTHKSDHTTRFEYFKIGTEPTQYAKENTQSLNSETNIIDELF